MARQKEALGQCGDYVSGMGFPLCLLEGEGNTRTVFVEGVNPGRAD